MTNEEAVVFLKGYLDSEIYADKCNEAHQIAVEAVEKQIPKKPYKVKEHKQNDYYCTVCKRYLGSETELKHDCLKPEHCQHCGTKIDWSN